MQISLEQGLKQKFAKNKKGLTKAKPFDIINLTKERRYKNDDYKRNDYL